MSRRGQSESKRRNIPLEDNEQPSGSRKRPRHLNANEIYMSLANESDDNYSDFDDDVGDPDFIIESDHNTESEQSDVEENQVYRSSDAVEDNAHEFESINDTHNGEEVTGYEEIREGESNEGDSTSYQPIDEPEGPTTARSRFFYGRNRYKWASAEPSRTTRVRSHNIVNAPQQVSPTECTSFEQIWKLMFSEDMIEIIVTHTNKKLDNYRAKYKDTGRSELGPINDVELKALIGLLFYTAVFKSNHENADFIFATDGTGRELFRCVMSKNRFLTLINCLRFDDSQTRAERLKGDILAAISELFNSFINNSKQHYTLSTHVCIDEMLVGFRGRCKFKIYLPSKPNKYGLKIMLLVDANTFYVYNAYIYCGRGSDSQGLSDAEKRYAIPTQSVIRLCKGIEGSNRNITADNWFTSMELLQALKDRGLTYLGTVKKNKKEIPPEFQPHKDRPVSSSLYGFTKDYTMMSYVTKPKKAVILLSSMHHCKETDALTNKPVMITDYNKTKGGVDEVDKKCSNYSCSRRIRRWPMVLFYRLVDLSGINSYILYTKCTNTEDITRGQFLLSLARELILPQMKLRVYNERIPRELRLTIERVIGPTHMPVAPPPQNYANIDPGIRKTCAICPSRLKRRTKYCCYKCKKPMCLSCCIQVCSDCKLHSS